MPRLENLEMALRNQISRDLQDLTAARQLRTTLSLILRMDNFYGVSSRFQPVGNDLTGEEFQVDFRTGLPQVQGVMAETGNLESLELPVQQTFAMMSGTVKPSHYQFREDVRVAYIEAFKKGKLKSVTDYVSKVSSAVRDAVMLDLNHDMFPTTNLAPTYPSGLTTGYAQENKIMAMAYALQVGRDDNDPSNSTPTTYNYFDLDMNTYTDLRAVNSGTTGVAFGVASLQNIRKNILMPLSHRGAMPDIAVCDSDVYDYILDQAEDKVVLSQQESQVLGASRIKYGGLFWNPEPQMDDKYNEDSTNNKREIYVLDSATWVFKLNGNLSEVSLVDNPNTKTLKSLQGYFQCAFFCENPSMNGRAYNVSLS